MLKEFDEAVKQRNELKEWWKLSNTFAAYDKKNYRFRANVCINNKEMLAFVGQQYAGDNNYHYAPRFFIDAFQKEVEYESWVLASRAYANEMERLTTIINQNKKEILKQLEEEY